MPNALEDQQLVISLASLKHIRIVTKGVQVSLDSSYQRCPAVNSSGIVVNGFGADSEASHGVIIIRVEPGIKTRNFDM